MTPGKRLNGRGSYFVFTPGILGPNTRICKEPTYGICISIWI